jgi:ABC-2 type transport system ATP-binding protein
VRLAIQARGLSKLYHTRRRFFTGASTVIRALERVDLEVPEGGLLALVGSNGAGKTTLLRLLAATLLPSAGSATIAGCPLTDERGVKTVVGLASGDDRGFYGRLSVRDNLMFFGALRRLSGAYLSNRVQEALCVFDLEPVADDRPVQKLSTGQRQRLSLARATLHDPSVLLLDEPTRGLDPLMTERVEAWLQDWLAASPRRAALLATHDLAQVERLTTRVAILEEGRLATTLHTPGSQQVRDTMRRFARQEQQAA